MELMSESVGILLILLVSDLGKPCRGMQKNCVFISAHLPLIGYETLFVFLITVCFMYLSGF